MFMDDTIFACLSHRYWREQYKRNSIKLWVHCRSAAVEVWRILSRSQMKGRGWLGSIIGVIGGQDDGLIHLLWIRSFVSETSGMTLRVSGRVGTDTNKQFSLYFVALRLCKCPVTIKRGSKSCWVSTWTVRPSEPALCCAVTHFLHTGWLHPWLNKSCPEKVANRSKVVQMVALISSRQQIEHTSHQSLSR